MDLNVNGTGQVSGSMTAEIIFGTPGAATLDFIALADTPSGFKPVPDPSCGPELLRCHAGTTTVESPPEIGPILFITQTDGSGRHAIRITCTGGGLAVVETVGCSVTDFA